MQKLLIIIGILILTSCKANTEFGKCVGILDDKNPKLIYELNTRNTVLSVIFFETVFTPIIVVLKEHSCPVGVKS